MPTKERTEHLNDVAEDEKGWRRRGDFKTDEDWQAGVNAKPESQTTRRTYNDQRARAASARSSSPMGSSPTGSNWPPGSTPGSSTPPGSGAPPEGGPHDDGGNGNH